MDNSLEGVIGEKLLRIIKLFPAKDDELFHLQKISDKTNVPISSASRLIQKLVDIKLVNVFVVGKVKLYKKNKSVRVDDVIRRVVDKKLLRIIILFLTKDDELFHLQKISDKTNVPISSAFRLIQKLTAVGLVDTINVGKIKLYRTNKKVAKRFRILK